MIQRMMPAKTFDKITPAWLIAILTEHDSLIAGRVLRVEQTRDPNPITQSATLLLTYSPKTQNTRAGLRCSSRRSKRRLAISIVPPPARTILRPSYI